jgi:hypothetical protein
MAATSFILVDSSRGGGHCVTQGLPDYATDHLRK